MTERTESMNSKLWTAATAALATAVGCVHAQTISEDFECAYAFVDLGTPAAVPGSLGGIKFLQGDPNTLLIGGSANSSIAQIYSVPVLRNGEGQITGLGEGTVFAPAPNIDGGLDYAPGGVLFYSRYSMNRIGQILPGQTETARDDSLSDLGFTSSVGAFTFVPEGFNGAGRLKVAPFNSSVWHDATVTPDGNGTFDISPPTNSIFIGGGPEGIVYVERGAPQFPNESVLVSEYSAGRIVAYETDNNGDPVVETRRVFMTGVSGAEGGTRDPVTGDFLFSTFGGGNRVLLVSGFNVDCFVNFNGDCAVNVLDVVSFIAEWNNQGEFSDFNEDGLVNILDVVAFITLWSQGCGF
jgi:hypothetical protein